MPQPERRDESQTDASCARTFEKVEQRRVARSNNAQPWIVRKFMVAVVLGALCAQPCIHAAADPLPRMQASSASAPTYTSGGSSSRPCAGTRGRR